MRKPVFFIALNGAILLLVFFFLMQSLVIIQMIGTADRIEGIVEVQHRGGNWQNLELKEAVHASDVVRTVGPSSSAELRWRDGTRIRLGPQTMLTVRKFAQNALSHSKVSLFGLTAGKVWVRVVQALKSASRFEIETPTAVSSICGTIFSVSVDGEGNSSVSVWEGKVHVSGAGKQLDVDAGRVADITKTSEEERAADLTGAREWAQQSRIVGPALLLEEPTNETTAVTTSTIRLKGYVEPGATLNINGHPSRVSQLGEFSHRVQLQPGHNSVAIVATDHHGRQTTQNREILRARGQ